MTINERLYLLIKALGLNNNSFAKSLGVNPTVTFNIIEGRKTKPSFDLLEKIIFTYDNINIYWLFYGEGKMFRSERIIEINKEPKTIKKSPDSPNVNVNLIKENEYLKESVSQLKSFITALEAQLNNVNQINQQLVSAVLEKETNSVNK